METERKEASGRKFFAGKRGRLRGKSAVLAGALWLALSLAGCSDRYENGEKVWIAPGGLGVTPGTWNVTEPWMVGTVLETKDKMVDVQVERGDSAGKEELKSIVQGRGTHWFPERQLQKLEEGQAKHRKLAPVRSVLTAAIARFALTGVLQAPKQEIDAVLSAAKAVGNDDAVLSLEILGAWTDGSVSLEKRLARIRDFLSRQENARKVAGGALAAWVQNRRFDSFVSGVLDSRKDRRKQVIAASLGRSVPGALVGFAGVQAYEELGAPADASLQDLPTQKGMADRDAAARQLWSMVLDASSESLTKEARENRLRQVLQETRTQYERGLAMQLRNRLLAELADYRKQENAEALKGFGEKLAQAKEKAQGDGRYWPLTDQEMKSLSDQASQALAEIQRLQAARKEKAERERKIRERNDKLLKQLSALTERFVEAAKKRDFATACEIANALPGKVTGALQALQFSSDKDLEDLSVPVFTGVARYEEYDPPLHGMTRLAALTVDKPTGKAKTILWGNRVQFRYVDGRWRIVNAWWPTHGWANVNCAQWLKKNKEVSR